MLDGGEHRPRWDQPDQHTELYRSAKATDGSRVQAGLWHWPLRKSASSLDTVYLLEQMDRHATPDWSTWYWLHVTDTRLQDADNLTEEIVDRYLLDVLDSPAASENSDRNDGPEMHSGDSVLARRRGSDKRRPAVPAKCPPPAAQKSGLPIHQIRRFPTESP